MLLLAGSFNHRAEALYRCAEMCPENTYVKAALARGLQKVRVLHESTPDSVFSKLVVLLNQYHNGSGSSHHDILVEACCFEHMFLPGVLAARLLRYRGVASKDSRIVL